MAEPDDIALLKKYALHNSEAAFGALVERHVSLVYSVAVRSVGNRQAAEDVAQAVFIILSKKARSLSKRTVLAGWLYQTTRLTAANFLRGEIRRQKREQEAYMQSTLSDVESDAWRQIAPLLDEALERLGERDRNAIVLRYLENKNLREVGAVLGASEGAAKMRVNRALEKLRKCFNKRGMNSTTAIIAGAVSAHSVQAAPAGLAKTISAVALAKGAAAGGSTLTLVKGALKIMAWTKAKTAALVGIGIIFVASSTTITVKEIHQREAYSWEALPPSFDNLEKAKPQVKILPTKFPHTEGGSVFPHTEGGSVGEDDQTLGISMPFKELILQAYGVDKIRTVFTTELPQGNFDWIANLEEGSAKALQAQIKRQFGIVGRFEPQTQRALVLTVKSAGAPKLTPRKNYREQAGMWFEGNQFHWSGQPASQLENWLEGYYGIPVVDQTGLKNLGNYSFDLNWSEQDLKDHYSKKLEQALNQVGFELIPTNMPIQMLVVEKAKN